VPREVETVTWITEKMCTMGVTAGKLPAICIQSLCELTAAQVRIGARQVVEEQIV
jgi:hypothetical protein